MRPNELLIHGHTHSTEKLNGTQIHVGVDAWNYAPATLKEIEELVKQCK
jgi:calcineurin-like phosphoesterase family protein